MRTLVFLSIVSVVLSVNPDALPPAWVSDPNNILSNSTITIINQILNTSRNFTMDCNGQKLPYQIAMVIVQSIDLGWTPETFCKRLMDRWGVGYARCNNGVIGFISIAERSWYILVGSGATSQLTNSDIDKIMNDYVKPYLRQSNYNTAMITMTQSIVDTLQSSHDSSGSTKLIALIIISSVFGAICIFCIWFRIRDNNKNKAKNNRSVHPPTSPSLPAVVAIPINHHEHHDHHICDTRTSSYDFGGGDSGGSGGGGGDW